MDRRAVALAGHTGDAATAQNALVDPDPSIRASGAAALERLGLLRAETLSSLLRDPSAVVRRRAVEIASRHPDVDVLVLLDDPDPLVAEAAAFAAGEHPPSTSAVNALSGVATGHEDALVREAAVAALGALGDKRGLPAILAATTDRPAVRRRAVLALAPFDGPDVESALRRALEDRDWQVRQAAEDLLAE